MLWSFKPSQYNDATLAEFFQKGLNWKVNQQIYNLPIMPVTMNKWVGYTSYFNCQQRAFKAHHPAADQHHQTLTLSRNSSFIIPIFFCMAGACSVAWSVQNMP